MSAPVKLPEPADTQAVLEKTALDTLSSLDDVARMRAGDFVPADVQILGGCNSTVVTLDSDYFVEFVEYFDEAVEIGFRESRPAHLWLFVKVIPTTEKIHHLNIGIRNTILGAAIALRVFRVNCVKSKEGRAMKKSLGAIAAIALVTLLSADQSYSQPAGIRWRGSGGWGPGTPYSKMYDPKTVETITGQVVKVDRITPLKAMAAGVHMTVKTDGEQISVHLGPGFYVENQDVKIAPKDKVEVKGSRVTFEGKPAIIAAEVKKGDETLKLRDENGFPMWSGWRRR